MSDPLIMDLVGTVVGCVALVGAGAFALWLLPWRDGEAERLERSAEGAAAAIARRAGQLSALAA